MTDRLSVHDRVTVLEALERISYELADIASWLSGQDADVAAVMLEDGARDVAAAGFVLETPIRPRPTLASITGQPANGYRGGY